MTQPPFPRTLFNVEDTNKLLAYYNQIVTYNPRNYLADLQQFMSSIDSRYGDISYSAFRRRVHRIVQRSNNYAPQTSESIRNQPPQGKPVSSAMPFPTPALSSASITTISHKRNCSSPSTTTSKRKSKACASCRKKHRRCGDGLNSKCERLRDGTQKLTAASFLGSSQEK